MTRDDPAAFAPPPAFGPFRVLHQIGIGALGPVFRTYEPTRDRLVAVKVFRLDVTPEQAQSLADELARAADAGLFHPSIVEPIGAGVEGASAYRAEEYVAAESLDVAMRHYAPASLDLALPFLTQLAGAIDFARTAGVGHGALHLRDVFVTPDEARASGFGIVEALERVAVRAPVRRPYSAPERIAGAAWSTPADVFSLAAIAYELLTGRRPSGTGEQIGELTGDHVAPHAPAIRSVLARAMDDDPSRRFSSALGFASALETAARTGAASRVTVPVPARAVELPPPSASTAEPSAPVSPAMVPAHDDVDDVKAEAIEEDDITAERDADATQHLAMRDIEAESAATHVEDAEDETIADLALGEATVVADNPDEATIVADNTVRWTYDEDEAHGVAASATEVDHPRAAPREERTYAPVFGSAAVDDVMAPIVERPRPAMLPMAFMLILGLLLGFAIDRYSVGGFESTAPRGAAPTEAPQTSPPAAAAQPQAAGRAYSEQAVAPRPAATAPRPGEAPPVPGDDPAATTASRTAREAPPVVQTARLTVISTPTHAGVSVNGRWRGRTPLTLEALPLGSYTVRVVQPGFAASNEDVTLSARQPMRTLSVHLRQGTASSASTAGVAARPTTTSRAASPPREPASSGFAGTIYVDSLPRGARVLIDGRPMGTTPASIPDIPIGSHVVRLELADHRVWTTSTRVAAGEQSRVTGSLERIR